MNDYSTLTEEVIERLQSTATDTRQKLALDAAWKVARMRLHVRVQREAGLNKSSLRMLETELESLERMASYTMNDYRHSVECLPYTYDGEHRPFEHEGFNPDFCYRDIQNAEWTLARIARAQFEAKFDLLMAYWNADKQRLSWDQLWCTPLAIEYKAMRDSYDAWSRMMGFPGYWTNWQK